MTWWLCQMMCWGVVKLLPLENTNVHISELSDYYFSLDWSGRSTKPRHWHLQTKVASIIIIFGALIVCPLTFGHAVHLQWAASSAGSLASAGLAPSGYLLSTEYLTPTKGNSASSPSALTSRSLCSLTAGTHTHWNRRAYKHPRKCTHT